jgi:hypothetical protein
MHCTHLKEVVAASTPLKMGEWLINRTILEDMDATLARHTADLICYTRAELCPLCCRDVLAASTWHKSCSSSRQSSTVSK